MKTVLHVLMLLCLLAIPGALFLAILLQQTVLVDELASAFLLSDKVMHASRLASRLLFAFFFFSLGMICWNEVLRNKLQNKDKTQNKPQEDTSL